MATAVARFGNEDGDGLEVNAVFIRLDAPMPLILDTDDSGRVSTSAVGAMLLALRRVVTGWQGPLFEGVPYRKSVWGDLDPLACEWWVRIVFDRFTELNRTLTGGKKWQPSYRS